MRMRVLSRAPVAHHVSRDLAGRTQQLVGGVLGTVWSYFSSIDSLVVSVLGNELRHGRLFYKSSRCGFQWSR